MDSGNNTDLLISALGLMFIFEGMTPFAFPKQWREMLMQLLNLSDKHLRVFGLMMMLLGLFVLQFK
jgi:uncharacterized protein YjeT (DUF2065 family)